MKVVFKSLREQRCAMLLLAPREGEFSGTVNKLRFEKEKSSTTEVGTHDVSCSSWPEPSFQSAEEEPASSDIDLADVN